MTTTLYFLSSPTVKVTVALIKGFMLISATAVSPRIIGLFTDTLIDVSILLTLNDASSDSFARYLPSPL